MVEIAADLTQAVTLEVDGESKSLTRRPENFSPVRRVVLTPGNISDGAESYGDLLRHLLNPDLRIHPTLAASSGCKTLGEMFGGD